jgi:structural maintenance of chromosome 3 (chondroitin sulfate proteoglycan 6)
VLQDELETLKAQEGQEADQLNEASKNAEKLLGKRTLLLHKRDEFTRKIQELGSLPTTELQRFAAIGAKSLMKKLHEVITLTYANVL